MFVCKYRKEEMNFSETPFSERQLHRAERLNESNVAFTSRKTKMVTNGIVACDVTGTTSAESETDLDLTRTLFASTK